MNTLFLNQLIEIAKPRAHDLGELAHQLEALLQHLQSLFPGNRVSLYVLNTNHDTVYRVAYFDGLVFNTHDLVLFEQSKYPALFDLLLTGQDFFIQDIDEFPVFSCSLVEFTQDESYPKSFIGVPFRIQGSLGGWITVSDSDATNQWISDQVQACKIFANLVSRGVLERHFPEILQRMEQKQKHFAEGN